MSVVGHGWLASYGGKHSAPLWGAFQSHVLWAWFFTTASIWEVVIKNALGRSDFCVEPQQLRDGLIQNGYHELAIRSEHALAVGLLPLIHKDPFDRILIAQAQVENVTLLTTDDQVARYPGPIQSV